MKVIKDVGRRCIPSLNPDLPRFCRLMNHHHHQWLKRLPKTVLTNFDAVLTGWRFVVPPERERERGRGQSAKLADLVPSGFLWWSLQHLSAFFSASSSLSLTLSRAVAHHECSVAQHVTCDTRVRVLRSHRTQNVG